MFWLVSSVLSVVSQCFISAFVALVPGVSASGDVVVSLVDSECAAGSLVFSLVEIVSIRLSPAIVSVHCVWFLFVEFGVVVRSGPPLLLSRCIACVYRYFE